jgi:hypothetical protein
VLGMLRCMAAAAAVDSRLMQQAAGHLFGLAGMLEQLVRVRTSFHCRQLVMEVDEYVPQLLRLRSSWAVSASQHMLTTPSLGRLLLAVRCRSSRRLQLLWHVQAYVLAACCPS